MDAKHKWARIIRPVEPNQLPAGLAAHLLPEVNVVEVDRRIFNPSDEPLVRQLLNGDGPWGHEYYGGDIPGAGVQPDVAD